MKTMKRLVITFALALSVLCLYPVSAYCDPMESQLSTLADAVSPCRYHTETVVSHFYRYACPNGIAGHSFDHRFTYRTITFANGFNRTLHKGSDSVLLINPCQCQNQGVSKEYYYTYTVH